MSLRNLKIWCSPLTNIIYAGYINSDGITALEKVDVSDMVKSAMMQYMHQTGDELECVVGELKFIAKDVKK